MGFLEKIQAISDEVYNVKHTYLFKIGNRFKCYTFRNNKIEEIYIDERFNQIECLFEWIIILRDKNNADLCVINVYKNDIREYKWGTGMRERIYREYIEDNLSREFIRDATIHSNKDKYSVSINKQEGYIYTCFNINGIKEINGICDSNYNEWIITPFDNLQNVDDYGNNLWVLRLNGYNKIFYKGKISNYNLFEFPIYIYTKNNTYLNCRYSENGNNYTLILKLDGNEYKEYIKSEGLIEYTCQNGIILKPIDIKTRIYNMMELDTYKIIKSNIQILLQQAVTRVDIKYSYTNKRVMSYIDRNGKEVIFTNTIDGNTIIGNREDIQICGDIHKRLVLINNRDKEIYFLLRKRLYKCTIEFNEAIHLDLLNIDIKGITKAIKI